MYARTWGETTRGINGEMVTVEVDVTNGMPAFEMVGLPDVAVKEARERVKAAVKNSGFRFPDTHITVNLAPADLKKMGPGWICPSPWESWLPNSMSHCRIPCPSLLENWLWMVPCGR